MSIRTLTSPSNPLLRTIRLAAGQARRAPAELVVVEGVRALEEAVKAGLEINAAVITAHYGHSERESELLRRLQDLSADVCVVPESVFSRLSSVQSPQGILALVRLPVAPLGAAALPGNPLLLCASGIQDPGNLGTLIRTADAAGASLVCTLTGTVSCRNPKTIRASAGTMFRVPVAEHVPPPEFLEFCRRHSITVLCASADGGSSCFDTDFSKPCAILVGNEGSGIDRGLISGMISVRVPMNPAVESLNVAIAGAVLLFEAFRQRSPHDNK